MCLLPDHSVSLLAHYPPAHRADKFGITNRWGQLMVDSMLPAPPTGDVCAW